MAHYVYFLDCTSHNDKKCYYIGYTSKTPSERFKEHVKNIQNKRTNTFTGRFKFAKLIGYQSFSNRDDALKAEKTYKYLSHEAKTELIRSIKKQVGY